MTFTREITALARWNWRGIISIKDPVHPVAYLELVLKGSR